MKKLLLLALFAMIMVGCENTTENIEAPLGGNMFTKPYQTIIIDSCEYVSGYRRIAHKGNCRFCAERNKRMVHQQVDSILLDIFE